MAVAYLGYLYGRRGERGKAQKVLQDVERLLQARNATSILLSYIYAGLEERENFFACMDRAYEEHSPFLAWAKVFPEWDTMRSDPRFDKLLRRMGLAR